MSGAGPLQTWLGPVFRPTEGRKHPHPCTGSPTPTPPDSTEGSRHVPYVTPHTSAHAQEGVLC